MRLRRPSLLVILSVLALFIPVASIATVPAHLWSQSFGSTLSDEILAVAVDGSGNIYITGFFQGTVDFGGGGLVSAGSNDVFVAKYNLQGVHQWSVRHGGTSAENGTAIAVDVSGNVFVAGHFQGSASFGGATLVSAGSTDIFLAKYLSTNGLHQWSARYGGTSADLAPGVAMNAAGDGYLTGNFQGTVDFGGGNLVSAGSTETFLFKFNTNGVHLISQRLGGTGQDNGNAVAVDGLGNVLLTGMFSGTANYGGSNLISNVGSVDIFLAKYDGVSNAHVWSQRFGGTSTDTGLGVACDAAHNVILTGYFRNTADFGGGPFVSNGLEEIVLAKYNSAGAHQWSKAFGGSGNDQGLEVATAPDNDIVFTGWASSSIDFGGGNRPVLGLRDMFVARFDAAGSHEWSLTAGGALGDELGAGVACTSTGRSVIGFYGTNTMDLGGGTLPFGGGIDGFLAMFGADAATPSITDIVDVGNDQGRQVRINFVASGHDEPMASSPATHYEAYRRIDAPPSSLQSAVAPGVASRRGAIESAPGVVLDADWVQVGTVNAHTQDEYNIIVPTIGDSTIALGQYHSTFFIRAATETPSFFFDSPIDSGYSLDNLAPGAPLNFVYSEGELTWDESAADDFDFFTVYGSNVDAFGSAVVVDYSVATTLDVTASPYVFYFVTATDFSGNEGKPARVNTLSGTGGTPKNYVLSVSNFPNPFNPRTTVSYTVPSRGRVTVVVYDARGERVATLVDRDHAAGAYSVTWNGIANGSPVSSGVYFARIEHNGVARSKKMVLLK